MNFLHRSNPAFLLSSDTPHPPGPIATWQHKTLAPDAPVQTLDVRAGETTLLQVTQGRLWVTCDAWLEDYFLAPGQRLAFVGPARLRISAEGGAPACLAWAPGN